MPFASDGTPLLLPPASFALFNISLPAKAGGVHFILQDADSSAVGNVPSNADQDDVDRKTHSFEVKHGRASTVFWASSLNEPIDGFANATEPPHVRGSEQTWQYGKVYGGCL